MPTKGPQKIADKFNEPTLASEGQAAGRYDGPKTAIRLRHYFAPVSYRVLKPLT